ncbi:MAG: ribosome biogenesis GTPase Der, partial [Muribaculaceae bacterium]|nr:ribosome biogenesis GTPase Der [Muribaculaceae bacterium]
SKVDCDRQEFSIVVTGVWGVNSDDIFEEEINKQVHIAIDEADVILFVVDASVGVTDLDDKVAAILRRSKKPVILVANKEDKSDSRYNVPEFYGLGLGDPIEVSSANGSGTGELLDEIVKDMPEPDMDDKPEENIAKFAIVGRPNAGKSSLINAFIGEERHIVTDIAGTTRDSIYHRYNKYGFDFYLVDTAGIRKKQKVNEDIEYYSVIRSIRAIEASDVCIMMIDATRGIEAQDGNIFSLIQRNKKGLVVCVNKWDLIEDRSLEAQKRYEQAIRSKFAPFTDFPIIFTSALTKQRIFKVLETAIQVYENRRRIIPTSQLNTYMLEQIAITPPPSNKGKFVKIKYVTMLKEAVIPTFVFFCNLPQWVKEPYRRFLENKIREKWDFHGTPIQIFMRDK